MIELALYFFMGIVYDILITYYYIKISRLDSLQAGISSAVITFSQIYIFYVIILSPEAIIKSLVYSIGCGIGTILTIEWIKKHEQTSNRIIKG